VVRVGGGEDDLRYRVTLSSQARDRFEQDVIDNGQSDRLHEKTRTRVLNGRIDYRLSATDEVSAQLGLSAGDWGSGRSSHPIEPSRQDASAQFAQIKFRRTLNADDEWMAQAYYSRNNVEAPNFLNTGVGAVDAAIDLLQTRTNLEFQLNRRVAADWRMSLGAEWRHESATSARYFNSTAPREGALARGFLNLEWRAHPDWLIQGGAMLEHHYFTGTDLSPRVAVNYTLAEGHTLRFNLSQAYRSPTFFEQDGNLAYRTTTGILLNQILLPASASLKPERILSREIGYVGRQAAWGIQWDIKLFRDRIDNTLDTDGSPARFENTGAFQVQGGDIQLSWQPVRDLQFNAQFARVMIEGNPDLDEDIPKSAPRNLFSLLARYELGQGWSASAGVYRSGRMYWLSDGDVTQAYTRVDARLARRWTWQGHEVEAALVGQNLGEDYTEFRVQNVFSQRVYGSLRVGW
ncbi:MAG: TonB-dependent receptor, partial [Thiobacillus sp.]